MGQAFNQAHFCMYDNNFIVKPEYVNVLNDEESK